MGTAFNTFFIIPYTLGMMNHYHYFSSSIFWLTKTLYYMASNCLPEQMRSHIDCICTAFLLSEFSNVFSNCLPEQMHSHIGCICAVFLRSGFSNVSSNQSPEQTRSHIGCICAVFLQCEFSNVFSI